MPTYQALILFATAAAFSGACTGWSSRLKADWVRTRFWGRLLAASAVLSLLSALVLQTRHAGTGLTTEHGWPKPFYFQYLSETGAWSHGSSIIYFIGNMLVFAAALLSLWTIWRLVRRPLR